MTAVGNCEPGGEVSRADVEFLVGQRGGAVLDRTSATEWLMRSGSTRHGIRR